jgi:MscS family membrane protein
VLLARLGAPLAALWSVGALWIVTPTLALPARVDVRIDHVLRASAWFVLFWGLSRAAGVGFDAAQGAARTRQNAGLAGMLPLGRKITQTALVGLGVVALLNELGFKVTSLLAGLGIGGLALALAAQKTVEHLLGSIAIGVDQPFRVGDFVAIDGVTGTVESIGGRSTRVRTLDRTLVTFPNGKLAEARVECVTARDRIRLLANLGLSYGTSAGQVRRVLAEVEATLRAHPKLWPEGVVVRLSELKDSSLNVEVMAWFVTTDWSEFTAIRQELLLRFLEIVEETGTSFAFPTRTVHLVRDP